VEFLLLITVNMFSYVYCISHINMGSHLFIRVWISIYEFKKFSGCIDGNISTYIYIYIYIYMCVCVCVYVALYIYIPTDYNQLIHNC